MKGKIVTCCCLFGMGALLLASSGCGPAGKSSGPSPTPPPGKVYGPQNGPGGPGGPSRSGNGPMGGNGPR